MPPAQPLAPSGPKAGSVGEHASQAVSVECGSEI